MVGHWESDRETALVQLQRQVGCQVSFQIYDAFVHNFCSNLRIENLNIFKPIAWVFSIGGTNVHMRNLKIDARSTNGFPFNTDGIDCSASNVLIENFEVANGDDVINVAPPAHNVTLRNVRAEGSHGVSVSCSSGSGGSYLFENIEMTNSLFGARFKGVLGTTCNISDVTWRNMVIHNASYPIHFIENYVDQEKPVTGDPSVAAFAKNFTYENIVGSSSLSLQDGSCISDPCWSFTTGQSPEKALYLLCNDEAHCENFRFKNIQLRTPVCIALRRRNVSKSNAWMDRAVNLLEKNAWALKASGVWESHARMVQLPGIYEADTDDISRTSYIS